MLRNYTACITGFFFELLSFVIMLVFTKIEIEAIIFVSFMIFEISSVLFMAITEKHPRRSAKRKGCNKKYQSNYIS